MKEVHTALAIDIGASNGRAIVGVFDGQTIETRVVYRFTNEPIIKSEAMYWNIDYLFYEVKKGLAKAVETSEINSVGIDTWGVDFGLLDRQCRLLGNPVHYRDTRTRGILNLVAEKIDRKELYFSTGNQIMEINTAFQLLSLAERQPDLLKSADCLLMMPDLLNFLLTGIKSTEISSASTTQLLDVKDKCWSKKIINAFGIKSNIFQHIIPSGTVLGNIKSSVSDKTNIQELKVISVAGHDTQCAQLAVPSLERNFVFISSGTWSLLGTELDAPLVNELTYKYNFTNEIGYGGKTSLLKNITGLWLIQESRRQWRREGFDYSFLVLENMAKCEPPYMSFIDPDDSEFSVSGDVPGRIRDYCRKTGQIIPQSHAQIVRCIYSSLVLKYRHCLEQLEECTGLSYPVIYIVGGGTKDEFLCQLTADATGRTVYAGPEEATVIGNICIQLMATGKIKDISEARQIIRDSLKTRQYTPRDTRAWNNAYRRFWK